MPPVKVRESEVVFAGERFIIRSIQPPSEMLEGPVTSGAFLFLGHG